MDRRAERYKRKGYRSQQAKKPSRSASIRTEATPSPSDAVDQEDDVLEVCGRIVRMKRFPIKPMTLGGATFQMEPLDHDRFMFKDG